MWAASQASHLRTETQFASFQNGVNNCDLRCVVHPRCWVQNVSRNQDSQINRFTTMMLCSRGLDAVPRSRCGHRPQAHHQHHPTDSTEHRLHHHHGTGSDPTERRVALCTSDAGYVQPYTLPHVASHTHHSSTRHPRLQDYFALLRAAESAMKNT